MQRIIVIVTGLLIAEAFLATLTSAQQRQQPVEPFPIALQAVRVIRWRD